MSPEEEASDLINEFLKTGDQLHQSPSYNVAKQCALISVNKIIEFGKSLGVREPLMHWQKIREVLMKK